MLDISRDINSLSNFKRNTSRFIEQLRETGQPVVLTINGKAEIVVQDARSYQRLLELVDRAEAIAGIRLGLEEMRAGQGEPAEEVFADLRRDHPLVRRGDRTSLAR